MSSIPTGPPSKPDEKRGSLVAVFFTFTLLSLGGGALIFLMPLIGYIGIAIVIGSVTFFGIGCFHYFVWGRWLDRILREEEESSS